MPKTKTTSKPYDRPIDPALEKTIDMDKVPGRYTVFHYLFQPVSSNIDESLNYCSSVGLIALHEIIKYTKDKEEPDDIYLEKKLNQHFKEVEAKRKTISQFLTDKNKKLIINFVIRRLRIARPGDGNKYIQEEQLEKYGAHYLTVTTTDNKSKLKLNKTKLATPYQVLQSEQSREYDNGKSLTIETPEKPGNHYTITDPDLSKQLSDITELIPTCMYCSKDPTGRAASSHQVDAKAAFLNHKSTSRYNMNFVSCCKSMSGGGGGLFSGFGLSGIFLSLSNNESSLLIRMNSR